MSKNPKIEFFKLKLQPTRENDLTFRDLCNSEYLSTLVNNNQDHYDDNESMNNFFKYFFLRIDLGIVKNEAKRKAFQAKRHEDEDRNTIHLLAERNIIHGIIKGGEYNTGKYLGEVDSPDADSQALRPNQLITDDFYFLLYTPLDKNVGVLILQSYTKDNISDIFRPFTENLFKITGMTNKATSNLFMPLVMQNSFKDNSIVKSFVYKNRFIVSDVHEETIQTEDFTISVEIKTLNNQVNLNNLPWWRRKLGEAILQLPNNEQRSLETFNTQRGYIQDPNIESNPTKFTLDTNNIEIKATIYLSNHINLEENGVPVWEELKAFALEALTNDVLPEIYPEDYLDEN